MKKKKYLLFFIILFISIGFAYLSTNLNITGSSLIKGNTWDVHFENVQVTSGSVTATTPTITNNAHQVNYTVTLNMPGDYFEFTVDAVNDGTIDAMVDTVSNTGLTEDQLKYLDYTVKLANDEPLNHGYILLNQTTKTYKVRLEYKLDISEDDLPDSDQTISLTFTVNYTQTDEDAYTTSTFKTGEEVSELMYNLAGEDARNVKSFLQASQKNNSVTNDNIASTTDSDTPIYLWFEADTTTNDGTGSIYWYSDAAVVFLNQKADQFFATSMTGNDSDKFSSLSNITGLTNISTSKTKTFRAFFDHCSSLTDISPLEDWSLANAEKLELVLYYCTNLTDISPLENWDISNISSFDRIFNGCYSLTDLDPLSNWTFKKEASLWSMFGDCKSLTDLTPLANWNVYNLRLVYLFSGCTSLTNLTPISNWTFGSKSDIHALFWKCSSLANLTPISNWDLSKITDLSSFFSGCTSLVNLTPISNWNMSNIRNMYQMFSGCTALTNLTPISNWNTVNVTSLYGTFDGCTGLTNLSSIGNWNTSNLTRLEYTFHDCTNLTDITQLSNWNTNKLKETDNMFYGCTSLSDITPLSNWTTSNLESASFMFYNCSSLTNARCLDNWDVTKLTSNFSKVGMFTNTGVTSSTRPIWF